jgi:hypothetical protein
MASRRSGSSSQRTITTCYPLDSAHSSRRRAARHSNSRPTTTLRPNANRSISRLSTSRSVSRLGISRSIPNLGASRSSLRLNTSQSATRPSTSRSTPRLNTSQSDTSAITNQGAARPSASRSTPSLSNDQGDVRPSASQGNTGLSTSRSTTRPRNGGSNTRPSTSHTNAMPKTQGRTALSTLGTSNDQQIICAISESRGISPVVGLAFVNLTTSEAVLCQISDNQTYTRTIHKLWVFDPSEILFMSTAVQPSSQLYSTVENHQPRLLPHARIIAIDRKYWSETSGQEYIQTLAFRQDVEAIKVSLGGNFYATCCFAAVCYEREPFLVFPTKVFSRCSSILNFSFYFPSPFIPFVSNMSHPKAQ